MLCHHIEGREGGRGGTLGGRFGFNIFTFLCFVFHRAEQHVVDGVENFFASF
jgi:hypothetical protein